MVDDSVRDFGRAVAGLRVENNLTQTELGNRVGWSTNSVSKLELGNRKRVPKREVVEKLERVLHADGRLLHLAGYVATVDLPDHPAEEVLARAWELSAAIRSLSDALYVVPSREQLEKLSDTDLVVLARRCIDALEQRTDPYTTMVAKSISDQLKVLEAQVGPK